MVAPVAVGADPDLEQRRLVLLHRPVAGRGEGLDAGARPDEREAERELDLCPPSPCPRRGRTPARARRPRSPSSRAAARRRTCSIAAAQISFASRMRSSSCVGLDRARRGEQRRRVVPRPATRRTSAFVNVVGSPTIRSEACVPSESSRPTRPYSRDASSASVERARERRPRVGRVVAAHVADVVRPGGARRRPRPTPRGRSAPARPRAGRRRRRSPSCPRSSSGRGRCRARARRARRAPARPSAPRTRVELRRRRSGQLTSGRGAARGSPCASCQETTGLRSTPIRSISASITSPGLRYSDAASGLKPATPRDGAGREHVAGAVAERRVVAEDLRDRHGHAARVRLLADLAVDAQRHGQVVRIGDLVGRDDPRAERAEGVDRLAEREDARAHLAPLDVARGDVVEDHVAADVVGRLLGREPLARLA